MFDWTVRVDTIVLGLGFLASGAALWGGVRADLKILNRDVGELKDGVAIQTKMLVEIARQDVQLKDLDRRMMRLEGGK